jgi:HlyD family secretion protein
MKHLVEFSALFLCLALAACSRKGDPPLLGTLEWDRIAVAAEASEPIVRIAVAEGDVVEAGQVLLSLDTRRADARLAQARADVAQREAALSELVNGARVETIAAARADLARNDVAIADAQRERNRQADLRNKKLNAQADLDRADTTLKAARAQAAASRAQLQELTNGSRPEDVAQAESALAAARAQLDELAVARERLDVKAPQAGRIDALPFKLGDQPPLGAALVSMLSGAAPYARVYVPEPRRAATQNGQRFRVHVDGRADAFDATVRSIRAEPAFTPYYALSGDDAARLSYRAELVIAGDAARQLPAGLPVQAERIADER